jgi:hypothetical protein
VVTKSIKLELFATTTREWIPNNNRDLDAHGRGKECLSGCTRKSQKTRIETVRKKDTFPGIRYICQRLADQSSSLR